VRWIDQVSEAELVYYVDGKRYVQAFEMRWYLAAELRHLLAARGISRVRDVRRLCARAGGGRVPGDSCYG